MTSSAATATGPAVPLGTGRTATAMAADVAHSCALLDNATVKCWGANHSGQLGLRDTANRGDRTGETCDSLPVVFLAPTGVSGTVSEVGSGA